MIGATSFSYEWDLASAAMVMNVTGPAVSIRVTLSAEKARDLAEFMAAHYPLKPKEINQ